MSEINNDLNETFEETMQDAEVITVPIDDTLTHSGEAADAAAVGAALALKADISQVATISVNGQLADAQGVIIVTSDEIEISDSDPTTVKNAIEAKADLVASATNGNFAGLDASGNLTDSGSKASDFKVIQAAVEDPASSGYDVEFISGISQSASGVITPSKKTVRSMNGATSSAPGTSGLVPAPSAGDNAKYLKGDGSWGAISIPEPQDMTGATASEAGTHGLVPAPAAGDQDKVLKGNGTWGDAGSVLTLTQAISIPGANESVTYNMTGITADYELIRWNFSSSAENFPPTSLAWTTGSGTFTITNNGTATLETIKPVFTKTVGVGATAAV